MTGSSLATPSSPVTAMVRMSIFTIAPGTVTTPLVDTNGLVLSRRQENSKHGSFRINPNPAGAGHRRGSGARRWVRQVRPRDSVNPLPRCTTVNQAIFTGFLSTNPYSSSSLPARPAGLGSARALSSELYELSLLQRQHRCGWWHIAET